MVFKTFRDGEEVDYWDPVISNVQGSLSEERRMSPGRIGKDRKEYKLVRQLNHRFKVSLYEVLRNPTPAENCQEVDSSRNFLLEERLSLRG